MFPDIKQARRAFAIGKEPASRLPSSSPLHDFGDNPFKLSKDTDLIAIKQDHIQQAYQQRREDRALPLWQKGVRNKGVKVLQEIREIKAQLENSDVNDQAQEPDILNAADKLLKNRPKKLENIHEFISRKKEMFLIQMKINQKQDQIRWFEERVKEKAEKLQVIESRMKDDLDQFNQFVELNKLQTNEQIKEAENETKKKLAVINNIKSLAETKTTKLNYNLKLLEKLNNLLSYKQFLDDLTPACLLENSNPCFERAEGLQEEPKASFNKTSEAGAHQVARVSKAKVKGILAFKGQEPSKQSPDAKLKVDSVSTVSNSNEAGATRVSFQNENRFTLTHQGSKESVRKGFGSSNRKKGDKADSFQSYVVDNTDMKLMQMIEQLGSKTHPGLVKLIRMGDVAFPIYFQDPNELLEIYKEIEEENLRLIKDTQKLKAKSEDVEEAIFKMKSTFEADKAALLKNKEDLARKIRETKAHLSSNLTYTSENINEIEVGIQRIHAKIFGLAHLVDFKSRTSAFDILKDVEAKVTRDIGKIRDLDKELVKKYAKLILEEKKQQYMKELVEQEKQNGLKKVNKIKAKGYKKNNGRKDVWRSYFVHKAKEVNEVAADQNQITENDKYFG